jgi:hypothetical protein
LETNRAQKSSMASCGAISLGRLRVGDGDESLSCVVISAAGA